MMQTKQRLNRVSFEPATFRPYAIIHEGAFIGWVKDLPGGRYQINMGPDGLDGQEFSTLGDMRVAIEKYYGARQWK